MTKEADPNADAEADSDARAKYHSRRRTPIITAPRGDRRSPHCPGIVIRNVHERRIHRFNHHQTAVVEHSLLRSAPESAGLLRLIAHRLHGIHHIAGLIVIGVAQGRAPAVVASHVIQHGRKLGHSFHARVPGHAVYGGGQLSGRHSAVLMNPVVGLVHLIGKRGRGEHLRHQRVRIERDGRYQLVELYSVERGISALRVQAGLCERHQQNRERHRNPLTQP